MAEITWIKLDTAIYDDEKIKLFRKKKNGDTFFAIWVQLLTLAGRINNGGAFLLPDGKPYTAEDIASAISREGQGKMVEQAIELFMRFEMIDSVNGVYYLPNWEKHQNGEKLAAVRERERNKKAKQRVKKHESMGTNEGTEGGTNDGTNRGQDGDKGGDKTGDALIRSKSKEIRDIDIQTVMRVRALEDAWTAFSGQTDGTGLIDSIENEQSEVFMKAVERAKNIRFFKEKFSPGLPWFIKHMEDIAKGKYDDFSKPEQKPDDFKTFELDEFYEAALKRSRTK